MAGFVCLLVDLLKLFQDTETKPDNSRFECKSVTRYRFQNIRTKSFCHFSSGNCQLSNELMSYPDSVKTCIWERDGAVVYVKLVTRLKCLTRGGGGGGGGGGALPINGLMGMCRWMGSHFHDRSDYNGVTFSSISYRVTKMGSHFSGVLRVRKFW